MLQSGAVARIAKADFSRTLPSLKHKRKEKSDAFSRINRLH